MADAPDIWRSAQEIADAKVPGLPGTKFGVIRLATKLGWDERARTRTGRGGGLEYPISVLPLPVQRVLLTDAADMVPVNRIEIVEAVYAYRAAGRGKGWAVREAARSYEVSESSLWRWMARVKGMDVEARAIALAPALPEAAAAASVAASEIDREQAVREAGLAAFNTLSKGQQRVAQARVSILRVVGGLATTTGLSLKESRVLFEGAWNAGEDDFGLDAETRSEIPRVSASSLKRWSADFKRGGLAGLASKQGQARKGKGRIDTDQEVRLLIEAMMLKHPDCSAVLITGALKARFKDRKLPATRTIQRWMVEWKEQNAAEHLFTRSPDKFRSHAKLVIGDASEHVVRLNQVWEMDSTPNDVMLADGKRYAIIGCIDVYSRRVKFLVARTSNAVGVAACMRAALLDWGTPEIMKTDNGSDYVSTHIKGVCTALEIEQSICPPFSPEKKPHIERVFRTFSSGIVELIPGFIGHNVTQRKDIEDKKAFSKRITKQMMKRGEDPVELRLTPEEMQTFCDEWTNVHYGMNPHDTLKCTPYEKAKSWTVPVRRITNERALDTLMYPIPGDGGTRIVTKYGISFENWKYTDPVLLNHWRQRVQVRIDEANWGRLLILSEGGEFICWALCPERLGVSRGEAAAHFNMEQQGFLAEMRKNVRKKMKDARVDTVAADIRKDRVEEAAKILSFPPRNAAEVHTTPALEEAAKAAVALDTPRQERKRADVSVADVAKLADARPAPRKVEEPRDRFLRWEAVDTRVSAGEDVGEAEARMWRSYQTTPEYESVLAMIEISDRQTVLGKAHAVRDAG